MDLKDKLISSYATQEEAFNEIKEMRKEALKNFEKKGFPDKKLEDWKYTSLRPVLKEDYSFSAAKKYNLSKEEVEKYHVDQLDAYQLVFVDGEFNEELSTTTTDKIGVVSLADAFKNEDYKTILEKHFNKIAPKDDSLSSLNTAFTKNGAFVYVKDNGVADKPIEVLYFSTGNEKAIMLQPRNFVYAGNNAQVKVIERHQNLGSNAVFTNSVTEVYAGRDAIADYYKIQNDNLKSSLIDNTFTEQGDNSDVSFHTFSFGGKLTRNNLRSTQKGEHINTTFKGITIIEGKQHVDHNTLVHHTQPNCESHQDYKGVFDDRSHGVFDGYILVDKIAQKTDGYQKSDNILMSDKATAHAKPQLEIYADDVICSHGCTIGQMDKESIFYMQSRGIPKKEAKALMMYAFTSSVLDSVKIPELVKIIDLQIADKLGVNLGLEFDKNE